jgi:hypothetical protein
MVQEGASVKKCLLFLIVSILLHGCTVVYKMPDPVPPTSQPQVSNPPQTAASPSAPAQPPQTAPKVLTISQSKYLCEEIQKDSNIAISCEFRYIESKPTMYLVFPNSNVASNSWQILTENLAGPFCGAANSVNRQANVVLALDDSKIARVYFCETNVWSEWIGYGDNKENRDNRY